MCSVPTSITAATSGCFSLLALPVQRAQDKPSLALFVNKTAGPGDFANGTACRTVDQPCCMNYALSLGGGGTHHCSFGLHSCVFTCRYVKCCIILTDLAMFDVGSHEVQRLVFRCITNHTHPLRLARWPFPHLQVD